MEYNESIAPLLLLSVVEAALNKALAFDQLAMKSIALHCGKVVRLKTSQPRYSVYVILCEDGVQLMNQFDGAVDARVSAPASSLALMVLGAPSANSAVEGHFKVSGNKDLVDELVRLAVDYNVWHLVAQTINEWIPQYAGLEKLIAAIERNEPGWVEQLEKLPLIMDKAVVELRQQSLLQRQQLDEIRYLHQLMLANQRRSSFFAWIGVAFVAMAWLSANGLLDLSRVSAMPIEAIICGAIGFLLVLSKLSYIWAGHGDTSIRRKVGSNGLGYDRSGKSHSRNDESNSRQIR